MTRSKDQERRVARDVGGSTTPASGAFWSHKGDVRSDEFLIEAKYTDRRSIAIRKEIWEKIRKEALIDGRTPVLALEVQDRRLAVLDWEDFLALLAAARDLVEGELP